MSKSRTKNVSRNAIIAIICQAINLLLQFVIRSFFIKILGAEYLGVNGLFSNVLTILSFAELGIGNAIVFSMYKPLAENNKEKIKSLIALYKKAYTIIGIIVACVGLCFIPFLDFIVKGKSNVPESTSLLYVLFLANTVVSYFFVYKKSIIIADQRNYIVLLITQITTIIKIAFQIAFLFYTHQYIVYLVFQIVFTLIENALCSAIANKLYPYLKEKAMPLPHSESKKIFSDVKALALYKFGSVVLNGTDNILISALINIESVGLVSNYVLLTTSCNYILLRITEAFTSSVGNLNATEKADKQYDIFQKLLFITSWIYGFATVGLITVGQHFILAWLGKDYLLSFTVLFAIALEFYVKGVHSVAYTYRTTLGYFVEGRWSAVAAAITNLVLSIILCHFVGLKGIFIATPISRIITLGIIDPIMIYKKGFKRNVSLYYFAYIKYLVVYIFIGTLVYYIIGFVSVEGWYGVLIRVVIVTLVFNFFMLCLFAHTKSFKEIVQMGISIISRKKRV